MNYRHAYHAGNFADVFKHALLTRILVHLAAKEAPFRYMDTHAGIGLYDLTGEEARKTGEAAAGVVQFLAAPRNPQMEALFAPYIGALKAFNALEGRHYPGSPIVAAHLLRNQDRLSLAELHPEDSRELSRRFRNDRRALVSAMDGWQALKAWLPPPERRGMVLVDPPFEQPDEFSRMTEALVAAHRRWATGVLAFWYPVKDWREAERFARDVKALAIPKTLRLELTVEVDGDDRKLNGTGMIVVNPPWKLKDEAAAMLPHLARALGRGGKTGWKAEWLVEE
jgi:23S rRNA (adenine2030-N6)-methyltransferase